MYEEERFEHFFEEEHELNYPQLTIYQMLRNYGVLHTEDEAYEFMGKKTSYGVMLSKIEKTAKALISLGVAKGDAVTICMTNCPQAIDMFYAISRIGAVANMIHPLSGQEEITYYLNVTKSNVILTIDQFYETVVKARRNCDHQVIIIMADIADELPWYMKLPYKMKQGGKYDGLPNKPYSLSWNSFIEMGKKYPLPLATADFEVSRTAVILYSGGTTGTPKAVELTDLNFNSNGIQTIAIGAGGKYKKGDKILSVMPIFHGFGLGTGIHATITIGISLILIPQFTINSYAHDLLTKKPNYIAGVPTLYEALLRAPGMESADLSFLKGMFCGGDSLPTELKQKVDAFLKEHHATIQISEGYGATETVQACCLTPIGGYRPGSIGKPFPDMTFKICEPGTTEEVARGTEGEICIAGPSVMKGYLHNEEETAHDLRIHADGKVYMHTGDLGKMDEDDYVYFSARMKRMIVSSGYNVYPSHVENVINSHAKVSSCCVIGVDDPYRVQRVKAFIVLKPSIVPDDNIKNEILEHCRRHIAKYEMPREIEFRDELPKTKVGKIAYRQLEEEEKQKQLAQKDQPVPQPAKPVKRTAERRKK